MRGDKNSSHARESRDARQECNAELRENEVKSWHLPEPWYMQASKAVGSVQIWWRVRAGAVWLRQAVAVW
jgi:hypothetical protein